MSIQYPNVINNLTNSQIVTQNGQACVPANLLDSNFQALANPVNPVIPVTGSISLSTANSGNIYELNAPNANSTITLPTPTNGYNNIFVANNPSSYSYTFITSSGSILWNNASSANVTPNTANGIYFLVSDGTNYLMSYELGVPNSISVTGGDLTMSGTTGTAITNATLAPTGVTAGTYGNASNIPQITVDSKGRITSANNVTFSSSTTIPSRVAVFTSSGTWTVPQGVTTILVSGCAAGGGGCGSFPGGAGSSVIKKLLSVTSGHSLSITIGSGGQGTGSCSGNSGGNTTIVDSTSSSTLLNLLGGGYGTSCGVTTNAFCGISGPFGSGGNGGGAGSGCAGGNGTGYGAGGGQGSSTAGGAGAPGIIIIEY